MPTPVIVQRPSPNFGYPYGRRGRSGHPVRAIIDHIGQGHLGGFDAVFLNGYLSAHYVVLYDGTIYQYVDPDDVAYHCGVVYKPDRTLPWFDWGVNPNLVTIGIEHEGFTGDPMPEPQYQATMELHCYLVDCYQIPIDRDHITGHFRLDSVNRAHCPGDGFPWERLYADLEGTLNVEQRAIIARACDVLDVNMQLRAQEINTLIQQGAVGLTPDQVAPLSDAVAKLSVLHDEVVGESEKLRGLLG